MRCRNAMCCQFSQWPCDGAVRLYPNVQKEKAHEFAEDRPKVKDLIDWAEPP